MKRLLFFLLPVLLCTSCFQAYSEDDDLRTVPVTNNPNIVPNHSGGFPGMSSFPQ
jgi:hypothetical protein